MNNSYNIELESKESLIKTKDSNKVIIIFLILSFSLLVSILLNLVSAYLAVQLATREKIFVTRSGEIEIAEEKDPHFRSDKLIEATITNWLYLTHEWDSRIPGTSGNDPGIQLKGEQGYFRVPSKVYTASYLLEIGFRNEFLRNLSQEIPSKFYQGRFSSDLKIYFVGKPERFDDNLYRVKVIMTRTEKTDLAEEQEVKLSQIIYLQATKPYRLVLGDREPSDFRKQLKDLLKNGLIIYKISPEIPQ